MKSEGGKIFFICPEKKFKKNFAYVGLTHFLALILNRPGTMEGLFREGIEGVELVGRVT